MSTKPRSSVYYGCITIFPYKLKSFQKWKSYTSNCLPLIQRATALCRFVSLGFMNHPRERPLSHIGWYNDGTADGNNIVSGQKRAAEREKIVIKYICCKLYLRHAIIPTAIRLVPIRPPQQHLIE